MYATAPREYSANASALLRALVSRVGPAVSTLCAEGRSVRAGAPPGVRAVHRRRRTTSAFAIAALSAVCLMGHGSEAAAQTPSERTTASAPTPQGPGLGNVSFNRSELYKPLYWVSRDSGDLPANHRNRKNMGTNLGIMVNGYFMTVFAPDSGKGPGGFLLFDVSDPRNIRKVKRIYNQDNYYGNGGNHRRPTGDIREAHSFGVANIDGRIYVAVATGRGVEFWDFTDFDDIHMKSRVILDGVDFGDYEDVAWQLFWQAPYLYVAGSEQGLFIVDTSDIDQPSMVERVPTGELGNFRIGPVFAVGNHLVVSDMNLDRSHVSSLDISDPVDPRLLDTVGFDSTIYASCFDGRRLYTSPRESDGIMRTYDLLDPANIDRDQRNIETSKALYCGTQDGIVLQGAEGVFYEVDVSGSTYTKATRNPAQDEKDEEAQMTPLGNLVYIGNDHGGEGSPFVARDEDPDNTPPAVVTVSPRPGAVGQRLSTRIGVAFSDSVLPESLDATAIEVRNKADESLVQGMFSVQWGMVNFSPFEPLKPNTEYTIRVLEGGVSDYAGNRVATAFQSTFSTVLRDVEQQFALDRIIQENRLATAFGGTLSVSFHLATTQSGNAVASQAPGLAGYNDPTGDKDVFWGWIDDTGRLRLSVGNSAGIATPEPVNDGQSRHFVLSRNAANGALAIFQDGRVVATGTGETGVMAVDDLEYVDGPGRIEGSPVALEGAEEIQVFEFLLNLAEVLTIAPNTTAGFRTSTLTDVQYVGQRAEFFAVHQDLWEGNGDDTAASYTWDFGDGTPPEVSGIYGTYHRYYEPGRYRVVLTVEQFRVDERFGGPEPYTLVSLGKTSYSFWKVVTYPPTEWQPTASTMITADDNFVYNVNPDNGTVTAIDRTTADKVWETRVGNRPQTLALDPWGNIWVTVQGDDKVVRLSTEGVLSEHELYFGYGSAPFGIAFVPGERIGLVTLQGYGEVARIRVRESGSAGIRAFVRVKEPRGIAISRDGTAATAYVTQFRSTAGAVVTQIDPGPLTDVTNPRLAVVKKIDLHDDETTEDSSSEARGRPNYLNTIVISPDSRHAWVPSKQDNIFRGESRDGQELTHETSVRAIVSPIAINRGHGGRVLERIDIDDGDSPRALAFSPDGALAFVTMQGNNSIEIIDVLEGSRVASFRAIGSAPQGIWIDDQNKRAFVYNFTSRTVDVFDIADLLNYVSLDAHHIRSTYLVRQEVLDEETLRGLRIFYNAADARMAGDGYISCATCHLEGGEDGTVWDFTDRGEGLRNTISLKGRGGDPRHGMIHWTANFDEIQDFENDIRGAFGGRGFLSEADWERTKRPLGPSKAGLDSDLDALATFVNSLETFDRSPHRFFDGDIDGGLTDSARRGMALFTHDGCRACHTGSVFTDGVRHDVGSIGASSGRNLEGVGFETPTLLDVWQTSPYFHDGSMATLADVVASGHGRASSLPLSAMQHGDLVAYLSSLERPRAQDDVVEYVQFQGVGSSSCLEAVEGYALGMRACRRDNDRQWWRWDADGTLHMKSNDNACITRVGSDSNRFAVWRDCNSPGFRSARRWTFSNNTIRASAFESEVAYAEAIDTRDGVSLKPACQPPDCGSQEWNAHYSQEVSPVSNEVGALSNVILSGSGTGIDFNPEVFEYTECIPGQNHEEQLVNVRAAPAVRAVIAADGNNPNVPGHSGELQGVIPQHRGVFRITIDVAGSATQVPAATYSITLVKPGVGGDAVPGACLESAPATHAGPRHIAVVRVGLSHGVPNSESLLDFLAIEGATVLSATRVDGQDHLWELRLVPSGKEDIVVTWSNRIISTIRWKGENLVESLAAAGNSEPRGLWSDGETLWVTDWEDAKLYAYALYALPYLERVPEKDFDLRALSGGDNTRPMDLWSNGETWWVTDYRDAKLYAYKWSSTRDSLLRDEDRDVVLDPGNTRAAGLWGDGETLWVADPEADMGFAYRLADGSRDGGKDLLGWRSGWAAQGMWSDGDTVWVANNFPNSGRIFAYEPGGNGREVRGMEPYLDAENSAPVGVWSDGHVMWVTDSTDRKIYGYGLTLVSSHAALVLLELSGIDLGAFSPDATSLSVSHVGLGGPSTVTAVAVSGATAVVDVPDADAETPGHQVELVVGENVVGIDVTAADRTTTRRYEVTVTVEAPAEIVAAVHPAEVVEGTAAPFTVTLDPPREHALEVLVNVTETGAMLGSGVPASVTFAPGQTSAPLSVPTVDDAVAEEPSTVTVAVESGAGYTVGAAHVAQVTVRDDDTVQDDDEPAFAVTAMPSRLVEGESATVTVAITNGVTYTERQQFSVEFHHSMRELSDLYGGPDAIPPATLARLASRLDYTVSSSGSTGFSPFAVQPSATAPAAWPSALLSLEPGESSMTMMVTAADDAEFELDEALPMVVKRLETDKADEEVASGALTILDPRTPAPEARVVSVEAGATPVAEGTAAAFTVRLDRPAFEALEVALAVSETGAMLASDVPASVTIAQGERSATLSVPTVDDAVVEGPSTVTVALESGAGYAVGASAVAQVTVEDGDTPSFSLSATPSELVEGESTTLTLAITNGVTFASDQYFKLEASGTSDTWDISGESLFSMRWLTLPAGTSSMETTVTMADDAKDEAAETVIFEARWAHDFPEEGWLWSDVVAMTTVTILADDATLGALSLSGIDIGAFSSEVTAYTASVPSNVASTEVTATATDAGARVEIAPADADADAPGHQVALVEGENAVTVTVTAADGVTQRTYTATVTMLADDATLSALSLSGIDIVGVGGGAFSPGVTEYTASVLGDVASTEVTATATDAEARVEIAPADADADAPGHQVQLALGDNVIDIDVTAADGVTQRAYTVTLTVRTQSPGGLWGDGETLWVVSQRDDKLTAFTLADFSRAPDKDLELGGTPYGKPWGVWSNGETVWVAVFGNGALQAYDLASRQREPSRDVSFTDTRFPTGLWSDGKILWVARQSANPSRLTAYDLASKRREPSRDVLLDRPNPTGLWSDGETIWVGSWSSQADRLSAYHLRSGTRDASRDIMLGDGDLGDGGRRTAGLWSDGETMWVADSSANELYEYALPSLSSNASLTLLELSDGDIGTFSPTDTSYTAVVSDTVTVTTLTALPASGARVEIDVPDAEAHTPGHQVALAEEVNVVTVTVTAADGVTVRSYTVTVTRAATEPPLTARLVGMPASHDGTSAFRFELALSEEIRIGYRTVRDAVFTVTGGAVSNARRLVRGSNLRWEVTVTPSGSGPVDIVLPAERVCTERGAICTAQGKRLSSRVEAEVAGPASGSSSRAVASAPGGAGTSAKAPAASPSTGAAPRVIALAEDNGRPAGLWSDGERLWVANAEDDDRRLYAYRLRGGARESTRDIVTDGVPRGLWSDGETVWVSTRDGGGVLEAYRLVDGARDAGRDVRLEGRRFSPAGLWSDGTTLWAVDWLAATARAYRLGDGTRDASRDVATLGPAGNWMAFGMWSDGETMWVSDQGERVYAYHMADGTREPARELAVGPEDWDPMGVWSDAEVMWMSGREAPTIRVRELPPEAERLGSEWTVVDSGADAGEPTGGWVRVPDAALRGGIEAALGKGSGEAIWRSELAGLEVLDVRGAGVVELGGLEHAVGLRELDLSFNAVGDLAVLSSLPALERLHLDGAVAPAHLGTLSGLVGLRALSVRSNGLEDLSALGSLRGLRELDVGDNRLVDLEGVAGLSGLTQLRADRNRLGALRGVESLTGLRALDVSGNAVGELSPLANLSSLRRLTLTDNAVAQLHELSRLAGLEELGVAGNAVVELEDLVSLRALRRLDVRGNPIAGVGPLAALPSLEWVHVGGCGIADFTALDGRPGLTVEGRSDQSRP